MTNFLVMAFVFMALAFVSSQKVAPVCAAQGWMCCTAGGPDGTSAVQPCDPCSDRLKLSSVSTGAKSDCGSNLNCDICGGSKPAASQCNYTGGDSALCRGASNTPSKVTLKVNQQQVLLSNTFAQGRIGGMYASSSQTNVATIVPAFQNLCCEWVYSTRAAPIRTTITAVAGGTSTITTTFVSPDKENTNRCSVKSLVTVEGIAEPLACIPGAKCTGTYAPGGAITCSMPQVTNATQLSQYGTPSYFLKCTPYKGLAAQTVISKTSTNGAFAAFAIATGVTNIKCSFRYCQTNSAGVVNCSNWGQGA